MIQNKQNAHVHAVTKKRKEKAASLTFVPFPSTSREFDLSKRVHAGQHCLRSFPWRISGSSRSAFKESGNTAPTFILFLFGEFFSTERRPEKKGAPDVTAVNREAVDLVLGVPFRFEISSEKLAPSRVGEKRKVRTASFHGERLFSLPMEE